MPGSGNIAALCSLIILEVVDHSRRIFSHLGLHSLEIRVHHLRGRDDLLIGDRHRIVIQVSDRLVKIVCALRRDLGALIRCTEIVQRGFRIGPDLCHYSCTCR